MKQILLLPIALISALFTAHLSAANIVDGMYQTLNAERGRNGQPTNKMYIQKGELNNQQVIAMAGCNPGCTSIVYTYQKEPSATLGKDVYFSRAGIYLFQYDENTWVSTIPDARLGTKPWSSLRFINVFGREGQGIALNQQEATQFALKQSHNIMNTGTLTEMEHGSGQYFAAVPVNALGKKYERLSIEFSEEHKSITTKPCDRCPTDTFTYMPDESAVTGQPTYGNQQGNIIFDVSDGVLIWAKFSGSYGKKLWGKYHYFNVYAKDVGYIRGIRNEKTKQDNVDNLMAELAQLTKDEMDKRQTAKTELKIEQQRLPKQGMQDDALENKIKVASERWASRYHWKETIAYSYFTGTDWNIKHHPLTGLITGRTIYGIIVMRRDDGLCSFHYAQFGQDYNGNGYSNMHMIGMVPGQNKLHCEHI